MGMHNDQKYGKSIKTSHEISNRDKGAKMIIILFICKINFVLVFKYIFFIDFALYLFHERIWLVVQSRCY